MRVALCGAGKMGRKVYNLLKWGGVFSPDEVVGFIDNDPDKQGAYIDNVPIVSLGSVGIIHPDLFVICAGQIAEIRKQLIESGIIEEAIIDHATYFRRCNAKEKYISRYADNNNISRDNSISRIVVYTSITGKYDQLNEPLFVDDNITYVCFTDDVDARSNVWNIELINNETEDNVHLAKHFKLYPNIYFGDYDVSVWVDGKYIIKNDLRKYIMQYKKDEELLLFPHPERNCIYEEAATCVASSIGDKRDIIRQITAYYTEGYPFDNGLYEGGCIVRWHNSDKVRDLMNKWNDEIRKYSYRDQISLPYVCWKTGVKPDISDLDINDNEFLHMNRFDLFKQEG